MPELARGVYSGEGSDLPPYLEGSRRLLTTGDVAHLCGFSGRWVTALAESGQLSPAFHSLKHRHGRWEPFLLFEAEEVDRYMRNRGNALPRRAPREPRQLRLQLFQTITGGKA